MKPVTVALTFVLGGALGYGVAARAQSGGKADPVKVDAKHYRVELENEHVRVLRIAYGVGEKSVMHSHPNAVAVFLTDGTSRMTTPDGKSTDMPIKAGSVTYTAAGTHLPQNVGGKPFQLVLVELK